MDSPTKRRALAPLDANASSPGTAAAFSFKPQSAASAPARSPLKASMGLFSTGAPAGLKRPLQEVVSRGDENGPAKKLCQDPAAEDEQRPSRRSLPSSPRQPLRTRSASPAVSSVFDASIVSNAHDDTAMTDPELAQQAVAALGPRPQEKDDAANAVAESSDSEVAARARQLQAPHWTGRRAAREAAEAARAGACCAERAVREASVDSDATVEAEMEEREAESEDEAVAVVKRAETTRDVAVAAAAAAAAQVPNSASDEDANETKPVGDVSLGDATTGLVSLARTVLPPST
ncbi:predicted protein [Verticillium alfalfae VaMs.102]|uniref:Predicted protein n=1 Tax=Verticillium alfalfae (strain VaMs.102 / ATCC MYA-4576 / FGSC 10136) TaxID=526221 RepID=C9SE70_VERA1|nr:predicted protein [Verticillium alfalfae VaMs.102]EEY16479.1 predicted protein [Verticillium alfalfae VaMs.102]